MRRCSTGNHRTKARFRRSRMYTVQTWTKKIPLARRQHTIGAEHSAPEGNGSSRSVRLGVPRRRDKRGRRRTVARAIPRSLSLTKYTINEGGAALRGRRVVSLEGRRGEARPPVNSFVLLSRFSPYVLLAHAARECLGCAAPGRALDHGTPGSVRAETAHWCVRGAGSPAQKEARRRSRHCGPLGAAAGYRRPEPARRRAG